MDFTNKTGIETDCDLTLAELEPGETGVINSIRSTPALKRRLNAMGVVKGIEVTLDRKAPMGDPKAYSLLGYQLSLRNEDASKIILRRQDKK